MKFELWKITDYIAECFAKHTENEVQTEYHDMRIGEWRQNTDDYSNSILRVE